MCKIFAFLGGLQGTQPFVKLQNYKKFMTHTKIVLPTPAQNYKQLGSTEFEELKRDMTRTESFLRSLRSLGGFGGDRDSHKGAGTQSLLKQVLFQCEFGE